MMIHLPHLVPVPAHILIMEILKKEHLVIKILHFYNSILLNIMLLLI